MDILKKWLPTGLLAIGGFIGLVIGFVAAFTDQFGTIYKMREQMSDTLSSHLSIAYIGGIIAGVLGLLSLGAAAFVGYKTFNGELEGNTIILIVSIIAFVVIIALGSAAMFYHSDLMSTTK